jgi:uncharacterized membrane protein YeaQ/YmgE (transglycosylase-associated protein family)
MQLLWFMLVGLIAGWLAGKIIRGSGFGIIGDVVIGVVGAGIGGFIFRFLGLSPSGTIGNIVVATVGAAALLYVVKLLKRA